MPFAIKRIYEPASEDDGLRVLVDRLWPRGISKARARLGGWEKDAAPSPALRAWFSHEPERFAEFSERYHLELAADPQKQSAVRRLLTAGEAEKVTLLYAAKDVLINHAAVLKAVLEELSRSAR